MYVLFSGVPYNVTVDGIAQYFTGDTLELNCSSNGSPALQYSWSRNASSGQNMFPIDTIKDSNYITINNVTIDDGGVYTCTVNNEFGNSSYDILIYIIGKNHLYAYVLMCTYIKTVLLTNDLSTYFWLNS